MDIAEAIHIMGTSVRLPGRSTDYLVNQVASVPTYVAPSKPLGVAAGLERGATLRAIEALHELSYVTRPIVAAGPGLDH